MSHPDLSKLSWRFPALLGLLLFCSTSAMSQWQWIDGTGRKVFSDTPPPASIPDQSILKKPGFGPTPVPPAATAPNASAPPAAAPTAPAPQVAARDPELEAKKKQADQADEARKKAEMERIEKARADTCERARKSKITMDSGVRIAVTNARGEREIMDDKTKAVETQRLETIIRSECGPLPKP